MELVNDELRGRPLRLEANMAGWQALFWDNQLVSQRAASEDHINPVKHLFEIETDDGMLACELVLQVQWQPFEVEYQVIAAGELQSQGITDTSSLNKSTPQQSLPIKQRIGIAGLASLALKLMKSAKVFKALLAVGSLAAYSWLFSIEFALVLIACLVFHEYGHLRAMRYFGFPTKGMYLIPFVGGLAVMDSRVNTRWQSVVIAIMGPMFGLFLSLLALLAYMLTGNIIFAAIASFNCLLNLFNLLPILPLDGGRVLQAITFSMHGVVGLVVCIAGAILGVVISYSLGLALLGFLLLVGSAEILFEWRSRHHSLLLPLDRYGQIFSTVWYVLTVAAFVAIIMYLAGSGDQLLGLPLEMLSS